MRAILVLACLATVTNAPAAHAASAQLRADTACQAHGWVGASTFWYDTANQLHVTCKPEKLSGQTPIRTVKAPSATSSLTLTLTGLMGLAVLGSASTASTSGTN